jgi:hypothetical protein
MFVPCIAELCIENQHCSLGFVNVFITNAAPTCFGTYVPVHLLYFTVVPGFNIMVLLFYSPINILDMTDSVLLCYLPIVSLWL